ncbi:DUF6221 family protein [Streptomyces sp. NPDC091383]|uniref:DUF6221 family protein n=1 Tax=Streptomyces sp. NPDC091383 TaxID=3365996 RepID=UPI00380771A3
MDELVRWLTAQVDADQVEAEKLTEDDDYGLDASTLRWEETGEWNSYPYLRVSKARVLREIQVKRWRLGRHRPEECAFTRDNRGGGDAVVVIVVCAACTHARTYDGVETAVEFPCPELRYEATVYAGRPGYRPEWRP